MSEESRFRRERIDKALDALVDQIIQQEDFTQWEEQLRQAQNDQ